MILFPQILTQNQIKLIGEVNFLKFPPYYLSGGTALALQIGHRTSLDFDFNSQNKFDSKSLFPHAKTISRSGDTLQVEINGVNLSVFYYPYNLIDDLVDFKGIKLAGLKDIAAMKIIAIIQRARQRDFIDIYYLIQKLGLNSVIESVYKKYPWYAENNQIIFHALTYFEDADADSEANRIKVFDPLITWNKVKIYLKQEISLH